MTQLTAQVADFVSAVRFKDLPERAVEAARIGIVDCMGVMLAGSRDEAVRIVASMVSESLQNDAAPEIPSDRPLAPADAALVNGVAAHVLDYDDVALAGHPSAVLVPAILAEGYALGSSGEDVLAAYAAGYEVWALLVDIEPGQLHNRGFHPTAVLGTLATTAACAHLHGLDSEKASHAIAIGASLASGLVANFGTMTKSFQAGRAAQSGVIAARLAAKGFTGSPDVLEHQTGFARALSPSGKPDLDRENVGLGAIWRLPVIGINVKRYPTCYATHRSIDAMIGLAKDYDLQSDTVKEIRVRTGKTQLLMLRNSNPRTALEAKFSMQFALASALLRRNVGLNEVTNSFVAMPEIRDLMDKVSCTTTDETMTDLPFAPYDQVSVVLKDGTVLDHPPVTHAKGSWLLPLTKAELREKFMECAAVAISDGVAATLFDQLWDIESLESVRSLRLTDGVLVS